MDRRTFLSGMAFAALSGDVAAQSVPREGTARIGVLTLRRPAVATPLTQAIFDGLRDHGYVQGRNLVVEIPDAEGREDRLPQLANELVRKQLDVILVIGPAPLEAARKATSTLPLVMVASSSDPVAEGVAASLARPGGNVTGLTYAEPDRFKKQLELLKSATGRITRVGVLWDFNVEAFRKYWAAPLDEAARALDLTIAGPVRVSHADDLPAAIVSIKQQQSDAMLVAAGGPLFAARAQVAELALTHRLPAIAAFKEFPQAGLLMSYGPDLVDINRRAGSYVDRILKGARPGDLPIQLPSKFDLVVNLRTAKGLGIEVPQSLRLRATDVLQ